MYERPNGLDKYWTVTMTFLKFFKFKQAKDETNIQDKLDCDHDILKIL